MVSTLITIFAISAVGNIMGYISQDENIKDLINTIVTILVMTIIVSNVILILKCIR